MSAASTPAADRLPVAAARDVRTEVRAALAGHGGPMAVAMVALTIGAALGLVAPAALGRIVDLTAQGGNAGQVWVLGGMMIAAALGAAVCSAAGLIITARVFESALARLRESMVGKGLRLSQARVERAGTGDLIARAGDDVAEIAGALPRVVPAVTSSLFTIALTFVGMAVLDWRYALALLIVVPVHVLAVRWYLRTAPPIYVAERAAMADRAHHLLAAMRGRETVHAFRQTQNHLARIDTASWAVVVWSLRARIVQNRFFGRLNLAEYLGMTALLVVGYFVVDAGAGSVGAATAAMLFFLRLFGPINQLLLVVDDLQSALASLSRIVGVIRAEPLPAQDSSTTPADGALVAMTSAGFAYPDGPPVLTDIDLTIRPGEHVGLVGASGAGKSTVATIVAGIHQPGTGELSLAPGVADRTVLVTQETHVFAGTLRENMTLGLPDATDHQVIEALQTVGADTLLDLLPDGLDTVLGRQGRSLTPAQTQLLALARLVLVDPVLAVVDEPTAEAGSADSGSLDTAAEVALRGRAALVVAHRLGQAARTDRILVMADGRVVEQGAHAELVAAGGVYAGLWAAWLRGGGSR